MNALTLLAGLCLGIVLGAAIGYLLAKGRLAAATADLTGQARAADERASAAQERTAQAERTARERAALIDGQLAERFQALSAEALDLSTRRFLEIAEGRLTAANVTAAGELDKRRMAVEHLVGPLKETLARVESQLRESDGTAPMPRWPSRSTSPGRARTSFGSRPRPWSPPCADRRPAAAGARCSCAGWSSWPG